jgi:flagellar motor switch protein FliM
MKDVLSLEKGDVLELNVPKNGLATLYVFGKPSTA